MNEIVVIIFGVIALLVMSYVGAILVVQQFLHKTKDEAKKAVDDFLTQIISLFQENRVPLNSYDVMIGGNGVAIRDEIVNRYFEKIYTLFDDWYYEMCGYNSPNVVCYQFRVFNPKLENFDKKRVVYRVKQIAERALTMHFHDRGIFGMPVDDFVAVTLCNDVLRVFIACNDAGFAEIEAIRRLPK